MPWTFYKSTDASAPVLTGQAGSLVALLDAILVNGYGSKAAAGWSIKLTATNARAYRMSASAKARYDLYVLDDGVNGGSSTRQGYVRMFEDCTSLASPGGGVNAVGGGYVRKSVSTDATARSWVAVADARTLILYVATGDTAGVSMGVYVGEIYSYTPNDAWQACLIPRDDGNGSGGEKISYYNGAGGQGLTGGHIARNHLGIAPPAGGIPIMKWGSIMSSGSVPGYLTFPHPPDGGLWMSQFLVGHQQYGQYGLRGHLRGLWQVLHPGGTFNEGDTFSGVGAMAGKTFYLFGTFNATSSSGGAIALETSDTVAAN